MAIRHLLFERSNRLLLNLVPSPLLPASLLVLHAGLRLVFTDLDGEGDRVVLRLPCCLLACVASPSGGFARAEPRVDQSDSMWFELALRSLLYSSQRPLGIVLKHLRLLSNRLSSTRPLQCDVFCFDRIPHHDLFRLRHIRVDCGGRLVVGCKGFHYAFLRPINVY